MGRQSTLASEAMRWAVGFILYLLGVSCSVHGATTSSPSKLAPVHLLPACRTAEDSTSFHCVVANVLFVSCTRETISKHDEELRFSEEELEQRFSLQKSALSVGRIHILRYRWEHNGDTVIHPPPYEYSVSVLGEGANPQQETAHKLALAGLVRGYEEVEGKRCHATGSAPFVRDQSGAIFNSLSVLSIGTKPNQAVIQVRPANLAAYNDATEKYSLDPPPDKTLVNEDNQIEKLAACDLGESTENRDALQTSLLQKEFRMLKYQQLTNWMEFDPERPPKIQGREGDQLLP